MLVQTLPLILEGLRFSICSTPITLTNHEHDVRNEQHRRAIQIQLTLKYAKLNSNEKDEDKLGQMQ
jgi:hypothetical protein